MNPQSKPTTNSKDVIDRYGMLIITAVRRMVLGQESPYTRVSETSR
ncbi:MAG: hypothetical protein IPP26_16605 [Flavobacteriales bacterium]|nr:hypothetical protein [Flavobacteriales bacterium]